MDTKWCNRCKSTKPRSEFYKNRAEYDGLQAYCKPCKAAIGRAATYPKPNRPDKTDRPICPVCNKRIVELSYYKDHVYVRPMCSVCSRPNRIPRTQGLYKAVNTHSKPVDGVLECRTCHVTKPLSEFPQRSERSRPGSIRGYCHACYRDKENAYRERRKKPARPRETERQCKDCGQVKPITDYFMSRVTGNRTLTRRSCRDCYNTDQQKRYYADWQHKRHLSNDKSQRRRARLYNSPTISVTDRAAIIRRDKSTCWLCHSVLKPSEVTLDHVIPLFRGGTHTSDNLRVACRSCNCSKGTKLPSELGLG